MLIAAYNVGSFGIRIKFSDLYNESMKTRLLWLPRDYQYYEKMTAELLYKRFQGCLDLLPEKAESIVISNGNLISWYNLKRMVEIAEDYAKKIIVISSTVARIHALMKSVNNRDLLDGEYMMIITPTITKVEFIISQNRNKWIYPIDRQIYDKKDMIYKAEELCNRYKINLVIINYHNKFANEILDILPRFYPKRLISFDKLPYFFTEGGLEMAASYIGRSCWKVSNFCIGVDAYTKKNQFIKNIVPFGAEYPFIIKQIEYDGPHVLCYSVEVISKYVFSELESEYCFLHQYLQPKNTDKIIVKFTEDGIPFCGDIQEIFQNSYITDRKSQNVSDNASPGNSFSNSSQMKNVDIKSNQLEKSKHKVNRPPSSSSEQQAPEDPFIDIEKLNINDVNKLKTEINTDNDELSITDVIILIKKENLCGIEVIKGEKRIMLKIDDDEEWIPSYISFKSGKPIFGQEAKLDYEDHPESVIFDIFKLIGKKYDEINEDPKWGFKIKKRENSDDFNIVVKFIEEERKISKENIVAIVLQAMKLFVDELVESDTEIRVKTNYSANEQEKCIIQRACEITKLIFVN